MSLGENLRMAIKSLQVNKMRALLTMLGIVIGTASVIGILTVGTSLSNTVSSAMNVLGSNNITVSLQRRNQTVASGPQVATTSQKMPQLKDLITEQMIQDMRKRYPSQIAHVGLSESLGNGKVKDGHRYSNISVTGGNADYAIVTNLTLLKGRLLSDSDVKGYRDVAVVSDRLVKAMFGGDDAAAGLGQEIKLHLGSDIHTLTVVGVYEYQESALITSQVAEKDISTNLYIPITTAKRLVGSSNAYRSLTVATSTGVDPIGFAAQLKAFFAKYYVNNPDYTVSATSMKSITEQVNTVMNSLSLGISVIAGISLLVGGIGVMNIMLVSVTERTREIGLRKAIGATPNNIRQQFLAESICVCLLGGVMGVLLGGTLGYVGSSLLKSPTLPNVSSIAIAVGFSISIGIFFGYYPANKAAKMNPIEALRSL